MPSSEPTRRRCRHSSRPERLSFIGLTGVAALARFTPVQARGRITAQVYLQRKTDAWSSWATEHVAEHDWRAILEAGKAIGAFASSDWIVARSRS